VAVAVFVALLTGLLAGVVIMARKGVAAGRRTAVPFGPFLALGGLVALLAGEDFVEAYLDMA
jgi:leader peptidase (prepilin peptidase)/N-methyltransferase